MNLLDKQTRLSVALIDATAEKNAKLLETLKAEAIAVADAKAMGKEVREGTESHVSNLWDTVRTLARSVSDNAGELDASGQTIVLRSVILDALAGNDPAIASVKSYTSTACKAITQVAAKAINWHQLETKLVKVEGKQDSEEAVTYAETRQLLKSTDQTAIDNAKREAVKLLSEIAGRENSTRAAATRLEEVQACIALLQPIRDRSVRETDAAKPASKAAKAAEDLKQQQPSAPMVTEVVQAEAKAA